MVEIWSTANILTRYLAFPPVFPRPTISKRINAFSSAPASKDGKNSSIRLIPTGSGDGLNLCLGWWPEGQTIISRGRKSSLMPSDARKNRSPQRWPLISIIPPINWRGLFPPARQIEAYANGCDDPIASGDPLALEKLQARLDYLTAAQERMKRVNAWYRGHGTALGCPDLSASAALKIDDVLAEEVARGCKPPSPLSLGRCATMPQISPVFGIV